VPKWIEVTLRVDGEAAEAATEVLNRYGYQGVSIEVEGIPPEPCRGRFAAPGNDAARRFADGGRSPEAMRQLIDALGSLIYVARPDPVFRTQDEQVWAKRGKRTTIRCG